MENPNRKRLDKLKLDIKEWLHIEDDSLIETIAAVKFTHRIPGPPVWIMIIGPSSGGKSELLKAFTQPGEHHLDDLTENTFVSGYVSKQTKDIPHFAQTIANKIWYIYDLSILMSKNSEERSQILSDMRMVYDGQIIKKYGNKTSASADCPNNTLICGTTPVIDNTILEDQQLGTRFLQYRIKASNRHAIMDTIDRNHDRIATMGPSLKVAVQEFEESIKSQDFTTSEVDNQNLQLMCNMTTLLRTSVAMDRMGEPSNLAYPEEPGRFYKQIKKMYMAYRMLGLSEEEAITNIRRLCQDNVNPIRCRIIRHLYERSGAAEHPEDKEFSTSKIHVATGIGKKTIKTNLHTLHLMGVVSYGLDEDQYGRVIRENWRLLDMNLQLLFGGVCKDRIGRSLWPLFLKLRRI